MDLKEKAINLVVSAVKLNYNKENQYYDIILNKQLLQDKKVRKFIKKEVRQFINFVQDREGEQFLKSEEYFKLCLTLLFKKMTE